MLELLRSVTSVTPQALRAVSIAHAASAVRRSRRGERGSVIEILIGRSWSEAKVELEPERPARRVRTDIDAAREVLVSEVADFRVQALVLGPRDEIAPADAHRRILDVAPDALKQSRAQVVGQGQFAQLHVAARLDVDTFGFLVGIETVLPNGRLHTAHGDRIGKVGR